jgi:hypothetical protein
MRAARWELQSYWVGENVKIENICLSVYIYRCQERSCQPIMGFRCFIFGILSYFEISPERQMSGLRVKDKGLSRAPTDIDKTAAYEMLKAASNAQCLEVS